METKYGFTKLSLAEFKDWLKDLRVTRTVIKVQEHHTYIPSYVLFKDSNHFALQKGMKDFHVQSNGWADIGQHFTIFPDGMILTGRDMEMSPACIYGQNANAICIENLGNFDVGGDTMTSEQKKSIVSVTALLCAKFNLPITTDYIVYHHWFNPLTGARDNGTIYNKTCPGTNFFGGNKVPDCEQNFLPLVEKEIPNPIKTTPDELQGYACVSTFSLNVRTQPKASSPKAGDRSTIQLGAILRVYGEEKGWLKISRSDSRWVSKRYTIPVERATITASVLNVRTGPSTSYPKTSSLAKGAVVFITETEGNWCKIALDHKWVSKAYVDFSR